MPQFGAFCALKLSHCNLFADEESHVNFLVTGFGCRRMMRGEKTISIPRKGREE